MEGKVCHHGILAIDSDTYMKRKVLFSLVNLSPSSQSLATRTHIGFTATVGMFYGPKIILYELQTQAAL